MAIPLRLIRGWWALALVAALFGVTGSASAQDADAARTLFQQGVANFESGDFEAALDAFQKAYRLRPHPSVRVNMANCFERLGRVAEAIFNYERFLTESGDDAPEEQREQVSASIQRLRESTGTLQLQVRPMKAKIKIDGSSPRLTPDGSIALPTGQYTLEVFAPGHEPYTQRVDIHGGSTTEVDIRLRRRAPVASAPAVATRPTPPTPPAAPVGPADSGEQGRNTVAWTFGGIAAALAVGSLVTGVMALQAEREFEDAVQASGTSSSIEQRVAAVAEGEDAASRANGLAVTSDILLGLTAASGTVALVVWLTSTRKQDNRTDRSVQVQPVLGRTAAGMTLQGRF